MKFGTALPNCREGHTLPVGFVEPEQIVSLAQLAEELGYDSIWADDHYTVTPDMESTLNGAPNYYEPLITLAACATATKRIKLCAGVICLPFRNPVILAKQVVTLDRLSNGRFILGVGLGRRDEIKLFSGGSLKVHRGLMMDETIEALDMLLTEDRATYAGNYVQFSDVSIWPKSKQSPLPIYFAGEAPETPRRIARWGKGAVMATLTASRPIRERVRVLGIALEERGRSLQEIDKCVATVQSLAANHEEAVRSFQNSLIGRYATDDTLDRIIANNCIGTPDEVAEKISTLADDGIDHCAIHHYAVQSLNELKEQVQMFAEEVIPLLR